MSCFPSPITPSNTGNPIPVPATPDAFRAAFPEFADKTMFPDESVTFWLAAASILLTNRWRNALGLATILFVCHNLALEAFNQQTANNGGIPGIGLGVVQSQAAKSVSISYDSGLAGEAGAGHWNLTNFGTRLYRLMMAFGAGPVQIGTGSFQGGFFNFSSWGGLPFGPGWFTTSF